MILPVSVCIPVRNEERILPGCLESLGDAFDEVVVVDSSSSDRTKAVATDAGAKVLDFCWDGKFPKKRNWTLRNYAFRNKWVLFLDADERVTSEFVSELARVLPATNCVGFWISFTNWFMGQPLRHGDVFRKLALFRIDAGEYERFPEQWWSHLDMEIHEHPVLKGAVGEIQSRLEHRDDRGLEHYRAKHEAYATWEANRHQWLQQAGSEEWAKLNKRQQFKYRNLNKWWLGRFYFLFSYLVRKGFLDGRAGWEFARLKSHYFDDVRRKIRASQKGSSADRCG